MHIRIFGLLLLSQSVLADVHQQLFDAAGLPVQEQHFQSALTWAETHYGKQLPQPIMDKLIQSARERFEPRALDQRARNTFQSAVKEPSAALAFFQSPLGVKVVKAETSASQLDKISQNNGEIAQVKVTPERQLLLQKLAAAVPIKEVVIDATSAVTNLTASGVGQMLSGFLGADGLDLKSMSSGPIAKQVQENLPNTLAYIYQPLSELELKDFVAFAESDTGKQYFTALSETVRSALMVKDSDVPNTNTPKNLSIPITH